VTTAEPTREYLDALVQRGKTPGIQYLAVYATGPAFTCQAGWADVRNQRPMTTDTTMMAYSMSKTITAIAVLRLVEAGKVGIDDPASRFVAHPYGPGITVRRLLAHTSGLPNPIPLRWVHSAARHTSFDETAALAAVLAAHPTPVSAPGARYRYSNIGYWLLGSVVEKASGQPFTAFVTENVLGPLDIAPADLAYTIPDPTRHARGYLEKYSLINLGKRFLVDGDLIGGYEGRWLRIRDHYPNGAAFGGLVGTARGFGKLLQDQLAPRSAVLGDVGRLLLYTQQWGTGGATIPMTLGWHMGDLDGVRFFYKEGGGGGFHDEMRLYPSRGVGTVAMANATGFRVRKCLDVIDRAFVLPPQEAHGTRAAQAAAVP
jgi:D-alanyl-D-alanine carboxypeptidase